MSQEIFVFADWQAVQRPTQMGVLRTDVVRGEEVVSFEYDSTWLASEHTTVLDPDLQLYTGRQFSANSGRPNFGLFLDSCPDRWGRLLMQRREAVHARLEQRRERRLLDPIFCWVSTMNNEWAGFDFGKRWKVHFFQTMTA